MPEIYRPNPDFLLNPRLLEEIIHDLEMTPEEFKRITAEMMASGRPYVRQGDGTEKFVESSRQGRAFQKPGA